MDRWLRETISELEAACAPDEQSEQMRRNVSEYTDAELWFEILRADRLIAHEKGLSRTAWRRSNVASLLGATHIVCDRQMRIIKAIDDQDRDQQVADLVAPARSAIAKAFFASVADRGFNEERVRSAPAETKAAERADPTIRTHHRPSDNLVALTKNAKQAFVPHRLLVGICRRRPLPTGIFGYSCAALAGKV
jgi:hypothetical protein